MCGVYGFVGSKKPNLAKLKVLGLYNTKRGKDSCGYFYNTKVYRGVDKIKEFPTFIENHIIEDVGKPRSNTFIGHTRQMSVGSASLDNCHPFCINDRYILAHNGTIENIWELCKKYEVDSTAIFVDSKALGLLFDKVGPKILEEYRGYATLLIHDLKDKENPSNLTVYHGASREHAYDTAEVKEERPLFGMLTREGYYFSSLEEGLLAIRDVEGQEPFKVETNKLIKIVGSDYGKEVVDIHREWNNSGIAQKKVTVTPPFRGNAHTSMPGTQNGKVIDIRNAAFNAANIKSKLPFLVDTKLIDISDETLPCRNYDLEAAEVTDYVMFWQGRYWDEHENLCDGVLLLNKEGHVVTEPGDGVYEHYFYNGILIDGKAKYDKLMKQIEDNTCIGTSLSNPNENFACLMSHYSTYPVTNRNGEAMGVKNSAIRDAWYFKGLSAANGFTPKYADRNYVFKIGNLVNILNNKNDARDTILMKDGVSKHANSQYFDEAFVDTKKKSIENAPPPRIIGAHFDNGEVIVETSDRDKIFPYFDEVYKSVSDLENSIPYVVYFAMSLYVRDVLESCKSKVSQVECDTFYNQILEQCIRDRSSLSDMMETGFPSVEDYIDRALQEVEYEDESKFLTDTKTQAVEDIDFQSIVTDEDCAEHINNLAYQRSLEEVQAERLKREESDADTSIHAMTDERFIDSIYLAEAKAANAKGLRKAFNRDEFYGD